MMEEKLYTQGEARMIAIDAARIALAGQPLPTHVSMVEAAKMLGVTARTVARWKLPRNSAGKIPYEAVIAARSSK